MIKTIIRNAINKEIDRDFLKSLYTEGNEDTVNHTIYQINKIIADIIARNKNVSIETIAYELHSRIPITVKESRWVSKKIMVKLKNSIYMQYVRINVDEINKQWNVNLDVKVEQFNDVLTFDNYKITLYDIVKLQYNCYTKQFSIKYALFSKTLLDKMYRIVSGMNDVGDTRYDRSVYATERQDVQLKLEMYDKINFYKDQVRNFTINSDGKMTCLPKGKESMLVVDSNDKYVWRKQNRQEIKFGKAVRQILNQKNMPPTSDKFIQDITVKLQAEYVFDADMKVVKGEQIRHYYHHQQYNNDINTESLQNSCMRHSSCRDYFDLYADNDNVSMLIAETPNGIIGRAILWVTDCGTKLMDRIYGNGMAVNNFKEWAKDNGYIHKYKQSYSNDTEWITSIGEVIDKTYEITLKNACNGYPYMDTFKYTDEIDGTDIVLTNDEDYNSHTLDSTEGGPWENRVETVDGTMYNEDEVRYIQYGTVTEGYYYEDDTFFCDYENEYFHIDDSTETDAGYTVYRESESVVYIEYMDIYTHIDNAEYSEHHEQYILMNESVNCVINGNIWKEQSNVVTINDTDYIVHSDVTIDELQEHINNQ